MSRQKRSLVLAISALAMVWMLAWSSYVIFRHSRMTADKVRQFQASIDLAHLSAAERMKALKTLLAKLNALSPEERQHWQLDLDWFAQLTEEEKAMFIDGFMPGEMKLALRMFEQWPRERQQKEIEKALTDLRKNRLSPRAPRTAVVNGTNAPLFSPELDQKIRTMGLNTLYGQSSAQTKAQLAPLLIEVQQQFASGQLNMNGF